MVNGVSKTHHGNSFNNCRRILKLLARAQSEYIYKGGGLRLSSSI